MKKHTKVLSNILAVLLLFTAIPLGASATEEIVSGSLGKVNWSVNFSTHELTIDCDGGMPEFSDPAPWGQYQDYVHTIIINEGVTHIRNDAFPNYENLTKIVIPPSVVSIDYYAFYDCDNVVDIHISDLEAWCNVAVTWNYLNHKLYLNDILVTDLIIPDGISKITKNTFYNCKSLTSVTFPKGLTYIADDAFRFCSNLTSITFSDTVQFIGSYSFGDCTSLTTLEFPNSVTSIGSSAFYKCSNIKEIILPNSVNNVDSYAFQYCNNLNSIYVYNPNCSFGSSAIPINTTVYGYMDSTAQTYADNNGLIFKELEGTHTHKYVATSVIDATCTVNGSTTLECVCGDKKTEVITAPGHDAVTVPEVKATCASEGYASWSYCSVCNDTIVEKTTIPAISHTIITSGNVSASCGKEGFTGIEYCAICNNVLSTGEVIPATNAHIPTAAEEIVVINASCGKAGSKLSIIKCSECGKTISSETVEIPKTNAHTPAEAEEYILSDATCTKNGTKKFVISCSTCSDVLSESIEVITAHGHSYNTNTVEPGCTTNGYTIYTCIHKDSEYVSDYVNAVGHYDANNDNLCDNCNCKMPEQTDNNENNDNTENTPDINININIGSSNQNFFDSLWTFILNLINMLKDIFVK